MYRKCCVTSKKNATLGFFTAWLDSCCHAGTWAWKHSPSTLPRPAKCHQGFIVLTDKNAKSAKSFFFHPLLCVWGCFVVALQCSRSECIWAAEQSRRIRHGHGPELRYSIHMEIKINSCKAAVNWTAKREIHNCQKNKTNTKKRLQFTHWIIAFSLRWALHLL